MKVWFSFIFIAVLCCISLSLDLPDRQTRVPGITSIIQCYKYNGLEYLLTEEFISDTTKIILGIPLEAKNTSFGVGYGAYGEPVQKFEYPFMVALGYGGENSREYLCGGSLVSEEFVLTAAHCIHSRKGNWELVKYLRLGDLNIASRKDDEGAQEFTMSQYIIHPNYTYPLRYNDIALIKLDRPVTFTKYVKPICLEYKDWKLHRVLYAAGWGNEGYGESPSDDLQKFKLRTYDFESCDKTYAVESRLPQGIVNETQICAGAFSGLTDTCEGDSGGPLLSFGYIENQRVYYQAGITSFGVPCALDQLPAVYTKVANYIEWIEDEVWPEKLLHISRDTIVFPDMFEQLTRSGLKLT